MISHRRYQGFNELQIEGSENILNLPERNVLFVSNHQTYFADVVAMFHVFNASLSGRQDTLKNLGYLWKPKLNIYFVAAKETMDLAYFPESLPMQVRFRLREHGEKRKGRQTSSEVG